MNAFTLISRAKAAGVSFEATPAGTVHLSGKIDAVRSLATLVRAHKQELMAALRPRRLWWIRHPCGGCGTVSYTPPATMPEVMDLHPDALDIEPEQVEYLSSRI